MISAETTIALVTALGGGLGIGTLISAIISRRKITSEAKKINVDAVQVLSDTAVKLLLPMREQLAIFGVQLAESQSEVTTLNTRLRNTSRELEDAQVKVANLNDEVSKLTRQLSGYRERYGSIID